MIEELEDLYNALSFSVYQVNASIRRLDAMEDQSIKATAGLRRTIRRRRAEQTMHRVAFFEYCEENSKDSALLRELTSIRDDEISYLVHSDVGAVSGRILIEILDAAIIRMKTED